ncbi:MAG: hypothetical protein HQ581_14845, partial [Planctomycetes bacterium]|nr:hypothetical protein [Planctomycetota bacterium]
AEQAGAKSQDAFDLSADSPIFAPAEAFVKWNLDTPDTSSPTVKAIRLYQDLLKFHAGDKDKSAWIDANLARLVFGQNKAFGPEKAARYKAALKRFTDRWGDHRIAARALHRWASVLHGEGELVAARALAQRGWNAFPDTPGGNRCWNLIQQIEARSSSVLVERVWNDPQPTIRVNYRNLTKVHFRAVEYDWEKLLMRRAYRPEQLDQNERAALLAKKPSLAWSADLPATDDYRQQTEDLPTPEDLKPGFYFLIASHDPDFKDKNNVVTFTDFWVSRLAIVMRTRYGDGVLEGFVLEAKSGEPIAGAEVRAWYRSGDNRRAAIPATTTDRNGLFRFSRGPNRGYLILARDGDQQLAARQEYAIHESDTRLRPYERTVFFTDRSLYRPGQTIQYKGICIRVDQNADNYQTLAGRSLTVVFNDRNGKEIARQPHRANDYGSFSGSFTAPRDRLMGRMTIQVLTGPGGGSANVQVEEYKRPKFQVALDAPKTAAKLGAEAKLIGKATAYTGAAIGGAKVRWRVVREVRYPYWWRWHYWWRTPRTGSQEIAHGRAKTGPDGAFDVAFMARPDLAVAEKDEPTFHFTIYADVTDTTGETRSAQRAIHVGYTALRATLVASPWLTDEEPVALTVRTTTLDGEGQQAEGSLKVFRLRQPKDVRRPFFSGHRPVPRRMGGKLVPPKPDLSQPNSWALGEVAW